MKPKITSIVKDNKIILFGETEVPNRPGEKIMIKLTYDKTVIEEYQKSRQNVDKSK